MRSSGLKSPRSGSHGEATLRQVLLLHLHLQRELRLLLARERAANSARLLLAKVKRRVLLAGVLLASLLTGLLGVHRQHARDALPDGTNLGKLRSRAARHLRDAELRELGLKVRHLLEQLLARLGAQVGHLELRHDG